MQFFFATCRRHRCRGDVALAQLGRTGNSALLLFRESNAEVQSELTSESSRRESKFWENETGFGDFEDAVVNACSLSARRSGRNDAQEARR